MSRDRVAPAVGAVVLVAFVAALLGIGVAPMPGKNVAIDETQYLLTAMSLAQDADLDLADELAAQRWRAFANARPLRETVSLADGRRISPHDPLLPLLLAAPVAVGGWIGAKVLMALLAAATAAATLWTAVRRCGVPVPLATAGVAVAAASAPLAVYGQQIYPEMPAALACVGAVAALTGPVRRPQLVAIAVAVLALPWLSVKYVPVAAVLAGLAGLRWWRAGHRGDVGAVAGVLAGAGVVYALVHRAIWGGWTVYASGDNFVATGEFAVVGVDPDYLARSVRLVGLLVDRTFGLAAWQPAWLLLVPAFAALTSRPPRGGWWGLAVLAAPFAAGWLVATYPAVTMHGFWWPGRQVVVVLPLAVLAVLCWLARARPATRVGAAVLALAGISNYLALLIDGWAGEIVWVYQFTDVDAPAFQAFRQMLVERDNYLGHLAWAVVLAIIAVATWRAHRTRDVSTCCNARRTSPTRSPSVRTQHEPMLGWPRP